MSFSKVRMSYGLFSQKLSPPLWRLFLLQPTYDLSFDISGEMEWGKHAAAVVTAGAAAAAAATDYYKLVQ